MNPPASTAFFSSSNHSGAALLLRREKCPPAPLGPQAEDVSWWLGSEGVQVGSEVMSDNGNTYTLWYADGVWSARFEPESIMIEGTGLVAMTRETDDMYDVGGATLPASGTGDVTVDGAMYHVWMNDGMLAGARFDGLPDITTDRKTGDLAFPALSANDPDTAANELPTHLILTGSAADGNEGMFSLGELLGSGTASAERLLRDRDSPLQVHGILSGMVGDPSSAWCAARKEFVVIPSKPMHPFGAWRRRWASRRTPTGGWLRPESAGTAVVPHAVAATGRTCAHLPRPGTAREPI